MQGRIKVKNEIAEGTLYVELDTVREEINFKAGQFFSLTLINPPFTDNRGNSRLLGFVNSPSQNKSVAFVTRNGPSAFKRSLLRVDIGTEVEISKVSGEMTLPEASLTVVTGGIGIAPYMSMLRYMKENSLPNKVTLIYANTKSSWAIFVDELKSYPNVKLVSVITEGKGLSAVVLRENLSMGKYYVSGTPRFVPTMVKTLRELGVGPERLKFEIFSGY